MRARIVSQRPARFGTHQNVQKLGIDLGLFLTRRVLMCVCHLNLIDVVIASGRYFRRFRCWRKDASSQLKAAAVHSCL